MDGISRVRRTDTGRYRHHDFPVPSDSDVEDGRQAEELHPKFFLLSRMYQDIQLNGLECGLASPHENGSIYGFRYSEPGAVLTDVVFRFENLDTGMTVSVACCRD